VADASPIPSTTETLAPAQLERIRAVALDRWREAGVTVEQSILLEEAVIRIADLPDGYLGDTENSITIDGDAAGHGWHVAEMPWANTSLPQHSANPPTHRIDLLTVLMHEMGHRLGLDHDDSPASVMHARLGGGVRREISPREVDLLLAQWS
jgi:hypothetical protein